MTDFAPAPKQRLSDMKPKFALLLILLVIAGISAYFFIPRDSEEDKTYYVSVFCTVGDKDNQILTNMKSVVEGGNSDYALQKIHFKPRLAKRVVDAWQQLKPEQKALARQSMSQCRRTVQDAL